MKINPTFPQQVFVKRSGDNPLPGMGGLECCYVHNVMPLVEVGKRVYVGIYELKSVAVLTADPCLKEYMVEKFVDDDIDLATHFFSELKSDKGE